MGQDSGTEQYRPILLAGECREKSKLDELAYQTRKKQQQYFFVIKMIFYHSLYAHLYSSCNLEWDRIVGQNSTSLFSWLGSAEKNRKVNLLTKQGRSSGSTFDEIWIVLS